MIISNSIPVQRYLAECKLRYSFSEEMRVYKAVPDKYGGLVVIAIKSYK